MGAETPKPQPPVEAKKEQPQQPATPEKKDAAEKVESPTMKALKERQVRVQKAQEDLSVVQRRLDQLKGIQAQLDAGTAPDALAPEAKKTLDEADKNKNNSLTDEIGNLESQRDVAKQIVEQGQTELTEAMKNLTPEEKLSTKIDDATKVLSQKNIGLGDVVKAIGMMIGALQEYFKYLKGELAEGKNETSVQGAVEKGAAVTGGDPRKNVREMLKQSGAPASADLLLTAKRKEKGVIETKIKGDPAAPPNSPAQIGSEKMRTELTTKRDALQNKINELSTKEKRDPQEEVALDQARQDIEKIGGELRAAEVAHQQNTTVLKKIDVEIQTIEKAMEKAMQESGKLEVVRNLAIGKLPDGALKTILSEATIGVAANKVDISITLKNGKTFSKDAVSAMAEAGLQMAEAGSIGVDATTGTITSPEQFIALLQKLVRKAELQSASAKPKEKEEPKPSPLG